MTVDDLKQKKIGILGFGQEGQAVLTYLGKHNVPVTIYDETPQDLWSAEAKSLAETYKAHIITGNDYLNLISDSDILFRSPGIWKNTPQILTAENNGTILTSQTKWFFENSPAKIIGVTGTKGKGTTSSLIYETLKEAGEKVYLTGNIGKIQPFEFLDETTAENVVVFELSSFQLQDLNISPHIAVCLMVTSDHLNHHLNLEEYHEAKGNIAAFQSESDIIIYNVDYPATEKVGEQGPGKKLTISSKVEQQHGAYISGNLIVLKGLDDSNEETIDCSGRNLRGAHNLENIAAAALATHSLGVDLNTITEVSKSFKGLEHRLQYVGTFNGVSYFNDSISTVPETTIAALNAFSEPTHLLLGGSEKGLNYDKLITEIAAKRNIMSITLLGEVGKKLHKPIADATQTPLFGSFTNFADAINNLKERAQAGDIVLLSPASASFDMFKNYAERGHQFVKLVSE